MTQIPVLLLTGYLGSGKTTLLNRILSNEKGIKFAVIVNDIGEVNIDADLIQQGGVVNKQDDSLVALQNGCICCTLKMDLIDQLRDIVNMKRFDYIVIEASGICEPAPIAQTISSMATLGPQYITNGIPRLDSIVTVVDALRMRDEFNNGDALKRDGLEDEDLENLVIQQIEFCNTILLNKAAEVSAEDLRKLTEIIRAIQPKAEIIPGLKSTFVVPFSRNSPSCPSGSTSTLAYTPAQLENPSKRRRSFPAVTIGSFSMESCDGVRLKLDCTTLDNAMRQRAVM